MFGLRHREKEVHGGIRIWKQTLKLEHNIVQNDAKMA